MMKHLAAALLCAPLAALGAQHIVEIARGGDGTFRHAASVAPGEFVELCGKLGVGGCGPTRQPCPCSWRSS